jgi:hypothetical protein
MKAAGIEAAAETATAEEVATHVLIPVTIAERLRDLSRRTRVTQSEYLREAVVDLLGKYAPATQVSQVPADPGAPEDDKPHGQSA